MNKTEIFQNISDCKFEQDADLTNFSTMKLASVGDILKVSSVDGLRNCLKLLTQNKIEYRLLGLGANQLLPNKGNVVYLKLELAFDRSELSTIHEKYILPASLSIHHLSAHAVKFGLIGWEVFTGIPATLGGALAMNAGTNLGEIGELVTLVRVMNKFGETREVKIDKKSFSYRENHFLEPGDVIYEAELIHKGIDKEISTKIRRYLELRTKSQPLNENTCGCIFKNKIKEINNTTVSCRAGKFLDIIGLKGFTDGKMQISPKHANFMVNTNSASLDDMKVFIALVQDELKLQFGIDFETEVKYE